MGWTGTHRDPKTPLADFYAAEFESLELLATATVNRGQEFYAAARVRETGEVFGLVVIAHLHGRGDASDPDNYFNITFKSMEESMGPVVTTCPLRIIDLLDKLAPVQPTVNTHDADLTAKIGPRTGAYEWRQRCRDYVEAAGRAKRNRAAIQPGDVIEFERPFGGGAGSHFVAVIDCRGEIRFRGENGRLYNISAASMLRNPCSIREVIEKAASVAMTV